MTGHQFESYYARLLESLGWPASQVTGDKPGGDGGAGILATGPRNRDFASQCKRYAPAKAVAIGDVRELNGALAHEHPNRLGMIVTTSRLTPVPCQNSFIAADLAFRAGYAVLRYSLIRPRLPGCAVATVLLTSGLLARCRCLYGAR